MRKAEDGYRTATNDVRAEHAKLGADATASDVHVLSARQSAQKEIVLRLLADKLSHAKIAEITGIAPEVVDDVARLSAL